MAMLFSDLLQKGARKGHLPAKNKGSRDWFRGRARRLQMNGSPLRNEENKEMLTNNLEVGNMYMFYYDPKTKESLPYYDTFPLIFPIDETSKGFTGINMHYLPPQLRAKLMDSLYTLASDRRFDSNTRLNISYNVLNKAARYKYFRPCIKQYLKNHVKSRFLKVNPSEWDVALFLKTEQFQKAGTGTVWADSRKQMKK